MPTYYARWWYLFNSKGFIRMIEAIRNLIPYEEFDYQTLVSCLSDYARPRDKITVLLRKGDIIRIKKGLYVPPLVIAGLRHLSGRRKIARGRHGQTSSAKEHERIGLDRTEKRDYQICAQYHSSPRSENPDVAPLVVPPSLCRMSADPHSSRTILL